MAFYSFDIFDTCIHRSTGSPESVFYQVGYELNRNKPEKERKFWVEEFVALRIFAENEERLNNKFDEPTIYEIWERLSNLDDNYSSKDVRVELEIEQKLLRSNNRMLNLVNNLKENENRIVFISDTYFSSKWLFVILQNLGYQLDLKDIYCSCELSKSKATGTLYNYISNEEKVEFLDWTHFGDNINSDIKNAKTLGIKTVLITDSKLNKNEQRVFQKLQHNEDCQSIIRLLRDYRLFNIEGNNSPTRQLIVDSIGPMMLSFAHWVLKTATEQGIQKLFFCSRDCRLLYEVCKGIQNSYPNIEKVTYFYTSRSATLLAGVNNVSRSDLSWIFRSWEVNSLSEIINKLGIEYITIKEEIAQKGLFWNESHIFNSEQDRVDFWEIILSPKISDIIEAQIVHRRTLLTRYFEEIQLGYGSDCIVDLGWHRTILQSINNILLESNKTPVKGIYLGLNTKRKLHNNPLEFSYSMFYRENNFISKKSCLIFQGKETILEHVLGICDHGTVLGFDTDSNGVVIPLFQEVSRDEILRFNSVFKELMLFTRFSVVNPDYLFKLKNNSHRIVFDCFLDELISYTNRKSIKYISGIRTSVYQDNSASNNLLEPITISEIMKFKFGHTKNLSKNSVNWDQGRILVSSKVVRFLYRFNLIRIKKLIFLKI